jgi:hypothetical protein
VSLFERFRDSWVRPALFFGNNPISLAGGAITTASGVTMISYWLAELSGHLSDNPYLGIIFFLILPVLFLLGLALIPVGVFLRRRKAPESRPDSSRVSPHRSQRPHLPPRPRHCARRHHRQLPCRGHGQLSRRGVHGFAAVLRPLLPRDDARVHGLQISPHSHVACVDCHIGSGAQAYFSAKVNGTKQLIEVTFHPLAPLAPKIIPNYPTPIPSPVTSLRPARYTCEGLPHAHALRRRQAAGQVELCRRRAEHRDADGAHSAPRRRRLALALYGHSRRAPRPHRIRRHRPHAHHDSLGGAAESRRLVHLYSTLPAGSGIPKGDRRVMDCIDCHNRAAHTFVTAEEAVDQAMASGAISSDLPWIHKEGLALLNGTYSSQEMPVSRFRSNFRPSIARRIPPCSPRKLLWSTRRQGTRGALRPECLSVHEGHLGNPSQPHRPHGISGLLPLPRWQPRSERRHSIPQDCSACHNLLAVEEAKPKVLSDLGIQ